MQWQPSVHEDIHFCDGSNMVAGRKNLKFICRQSLSSENWRTAPLVFARTRKFRTMIGNWTACLSRRRHLISRDSGMAQLEERTQKLSGTHRLPCFNSTIILSIRPSASLTAAKRMFCRAKMVQGMKAWAFQYECLLKECEGVLFAFIRQ